MQLKTIAFYAFVLGGIFLGVSILITVFLIGPAKKREAYLSMAQQHIQSINRALQRYQEDYSGDYPQGDANKIIEQLEGDNQQGVVYLFWPRLDPWKEPYILKKSQKGTLPIFYSSGPNKVDDGCRPDSDDISVQSTK
jgi:hypothetical protein